MEKYKEILEELNSCIWDYSELKFEEFKSSEKIKEILKKYDFKVESNLAEMETAFTATYGSGKPIIGILAEYDALSGLSQEANALIPIPRKNISTGHGCGHNLLGTATVGACLKIKDYLVNSKKSGTIVLIGCPAGGNAVLTGSLQANCQAYFRFKGISSHAAGAPHLGRSALDAVELMNVGVNYMREHIEPTDRIHYAVTDTGGISPNVVQNHAEVLYLIRSTTTEKVNKLYERVCKVAKGASLMTETEVEIIFDKACSNIISNNILEEILYESMLETPLPNYTDEELKFASNMKNTILDTDIESDLSLMLVSGNTKKDLVKKYKECLMSNIILEHKHLEINLPGSSDVGDCSHVVPTAQFVAACFVPGTPAHSWQMVSQGKSGIAVKGMIYASEVLTKTALKIINNPEIVKKAKDEFLAITGGIKYQCPIPKEIKPKKKKF